MVSEREGVSEVVEAVEMVEVVEIPSVAQHGAVSGSFGDPERSVGS